MDRATELELLEELGGLRAARSFFVDDAVTAWPVARYTCPDRFTREMQALFRTMPAVAAHSSELAGPDAFLTRDHAGLPLLLTRVRMVARTPSSTSAATAAPGWSARREAAGAASPAPTTPGPTTTAAHSRAYPTAPPAFPASTGRVGPAAPWLHRSPRLDLDRARRRAGYRRVARRPGGGFRLVRRGRPADRSRGAPGMGGELEESCMRAASNPTISASPTRTRSARSSRTPCRATGCSAGISARSCRGRASMPRWRCRRIAGRCAARPTSSIRSFRPASCLSRRTISSGSRPCPWRRT